MFVCICVFKIYFLDTAGQTREFWDALQRVTHRGAAAGFRSAVCLLGAGNNQWYTSGLEMPARIHRNLWLYHRTIHSFIHIFNRSESQSLRKYWDYLSRCLQLLKSQIPCLSLQTVMEESQWRPHRQDHSETCTSWASSSPPFVEGCCSYSLSTVSSHKRYGSSVF